jgi:hypothetical protein
VRDGAGTQNQHQAPRLLPSLLRLINNDESNRSLGSQLLPLALLRSPGVPRAGGQVNAQESVEHDDALQRAWPLLLLLLLLLLLQQLPQRVVEQEAQLTALAVRVGEDDERRRQLAPCAQQPQQPQLIDHGSGARVAPAQDKHLARGQQAGRGRTQPSQSVRSQLRPCSSECPQPQAKSIQRTSHVTRLVTSAGATLHGPLSRQGVNGAADGFL